MTFAFYTDVEMETPAKNIVFDFSIGNTIIKQLYFGSHYFGETLTPVTDSEIIITPVLNIKTWAPNLLIRGGDFIVPSVPNGFMYKVNFSQGGVTGVVEPNWGEGLNSKIREVIAISDDETDDTTNEYINYGELYNINSIKLSKTENGLSTAIGGASLSLGSSMEGGDAQSIFIQVENNSSTFKDDSSAGAIGIDLNDCTCNIEMDYID